MVNRRDIKSMEAVDHWDSKTVDLANKTNEVNKERLVPPKKDKFWEFSNAIPPIRHLCRATTMWIETIWKQWSITALARTESC